MNTDEREIVAAHLLRAFVRESNRIEGIAREPLEAELEAHSAFLDAPNVTRRSLVELLAVLQPNAVLRDRVGLNVRVGNHIPPFGGPLVPAMLDAILNHAQPENAWQTHVEYEWLHPFTDGNGRTGRALWAWQMVRNGDCLALGFLHRFYYQTLQNARDDSA